MIHPTLTEMISPYHKKKLFLLRYSDAPKGKQSFQTVFNKVQRPNKCILG